MNYITNNIVADKIVGCEKTQIIQEGEVILSEGQPDIETVLKCDGRIICEESKAEENRLSYKGRLIINILYCGKDKNVHSISTEVPINDFINIEGANNKMLTSVDMSISNIECKKLNERKVGYKIMAEIKGMVTDTAEIEAITDIYEIPKDQQITKTISTTRTLCNKNDSFTLTEDITLPATKLSIDEILSVNCNITNTDFKPQDDIVNASGDVSVTMLYTSTEGGFPEIYEFDIPFNIALDAENTEPSSNADVKLYIKDCFYNVTENDDGEPKVINMEINIGANIHTSQVEEMEILGDAYALNNNIAFDITTLCYSNIVCRNRGQCPVKEVVTLDEKNPDMLQIFRATGTAFVDDVNIYENKIVVDGAINIDIMYITGNDEMPIASHSDSIPFTQTIDARGAVEGMEADIDANIAHIGFNMLSDREVEVRCALNTNTVVRNKECVDIITDAVVTPLLPEVIDKIPSITIYVVKKGDTLWKLAKKFNTTVNNIATINNIENPDLIYHNQKLIIVKNG